MKGILTWIFGIIYLLFLPAVISLGLVRLVAKHFASPEPWRWEEVFISESPHAKSYHYSENCKFLKKSKYDIFSMSYNEAEFEVGLDPCRSCLKESVKEKYDEFAMFLWFPITVILGAAYNEIYIFLKKYKFQSPLVRRQYE